MGHSSIGGLYGVYKECSIGGMYGVWLYWWAVWGIVLLVGGMGHSYWWGCMGYSSIGGLYGV